MTETTGEPQEAVIPDDDREPEPEEPEERRPGYRPLRHPPRIRSGMAPAPRLPRGENT